MFLNTLSGALVSSIYHLIIFLIIWDGFDSDAENQIAEIKKKCWNWFIPYFISRALVFQIKKLW